MCVCVCVCVCVTFVNALLGEQCKHQQGCMSCLFLNGLKSAGLLTASHTPSSRQRLFVLCSTSRNWSPIMQRRLRLRLDFTSLPRLQASHQTLPYVFPLLARSRTGSPRELQHADRLVLYSMFQSGCEIMPSLDHMIILVAEATSAKKGSGTSDESSLRHFDLVRGCL